MKRKALSIFLMMAIVSAGIQVPKAAEAVTEYEPPEALESTAESNEAWEFDTEDLAVPETEIWDGEILDSGSTETWNPENSDLDTGFSDEVPFESDFSQSEPEGDFRQTGGYVFAGYLPDGTPNYVWEEREIQIPEGDMEYVGDNETTSSLLFLTAVRILSCMNH